MAHWRITKVQIPYYGEVIPECDTDSLPAQFTLEDTESGAIATDTVCININSGRFCATLDVLTDAGFTPNDWNTYCHP